MMMPSFKAPTRPSLSTRVQLKPQRPQLAVNRPILSRRLTPPLASSSSTSSSMPSTAADCVNQGLAIFPDRSRTEQALALFLAAMDKRPSNDEARAAQYNAACALTRLQRFPEAAARLTSAIVDHDLKISVPASDPDLAALRERKEYLDVLAAAAQGRVGLSEELSVKMRAEAKSPFRLVRTFLFGGLLLGATAGLAIITTRLIAAVQGGEGAPNLQETAQNFAINAAAVGAFGFLLLRDVKGEQRDRSVIEREEALGQLSVQTAPNRIVTLASLRGTIRPLILAGSRRAVQKAIDAARPYKEEMIMRGMMLVPVVTSETDDGGEVVEDKLAALKAEMSGAASSSKGFGGGGGGGVATAPSTVAAPVDAAPPTPVKNERRFRAEPAQMEEWEKWLSEQRTLAGLDKATAAGKAQLLYVQIQLDGTVRASGVNVPPYAKFMDDVADLQSVRTKFTDGV